jgi:hypothetical protein
MMTNIKTATKGEHVRIGNNETMKATAIGDLTLEQKITRKEAEIGRSDGRPGFCNKFDQCGKDDSERK